MRSESSRRDFFLFRKIMVGSLVALSQTRLIDYCIHSCYSSVLNTRWSCFHVDLERCIVCCSLRAVLYHSYSFKYIQVFGGMGRKRHWWKKKPEFGKDFSLLVSISLDKVCVSFPVSIPVSIPLDKVSIRSKLQCLKQDLVSALPRSWVDITPSSDTDHIIICKALYYQMSNTGRVQFTIHIKTNFNWSAYFDQNLLDYATCKVLQVIPCPLQGVIDVLSLINTLDKAQICQGHTNAKYAGLVAHRNVNVRY